MVEMFFKDSANYHFVKFVLFQLVVLPLSVVLMLIMGWVASMFFGVIYDTAKGRKDTKIRPLIIYFVGFIFVPMLFYSEHFKFQKDEFLIFLLIYVLLPSIYAGILYISMYGKNNER
ncbi:MAG: hypothetical protein EOL93_00590 [Epsilonproteobacteria bacterium]|nr:hypothetical protein [Campylobacterota bacterium]